MPELPEVETSRKGIEPHLQGQKVVDVVVRQPQLRWLIPADLKELSVGRKIQSVARRGKYLMLELGHGAIMIHLGMSGSLRVVSRDTLVEKHDHVDIVVGSGAVLRLTDPRRFGSVLWNDQGFEHKLLANLGPEPLSEAFTFESLFAPSRGKKVPIKTYIMNSNIVVGVGNIYANEALFMAGIRPTNSAGGVSKARFERLYAAIVEVLARAIEQGGTTLKDFVGGDGKPGYFKQELQVYGRGGEACNTCGGILIEQKIAQRATVYCKRCQR